MKLEDPIAMVRNTTIDGLSCIYRLLTKVEIKIARLATEVFFCVLINSLGPDCLKGGWRCPAFEQLGADPLTKKNLRSQYPVI